MGRRSVHTPDELRQVIIEAATSIVAEKGFAGLSAREIARKIKYSAGTLYNVFDNIDDLLVTIEIRLLDTLAAHLDSQPKTGDVRTDLRTLASAYLNFARENQNLWNLVTDHHLAQGTKLSNEFNGRLSRLSDFVTLAINPIAAMPDCQRTKEAASVLWAGIHGINALAASGKCPTVTYDNAGLLVDNLIETYLAGLKLPEAEKPRKAAG